MRVQTRDLACLAIVFLVLLAATLAWSPGFSQEADEAAAAAESDSDAEPSDDDEDIEDLDPSISGEYEEEEDTFIPSQEVSSDQSLNFPVDI